MYRSLALIVGAIVIGVALVAVAGMGAALTEADVIGMIFFVIGGLLIWRLAGLAAEPEDQPFLVRVAVGSQALRGVWCLLKNTLLAGFSQRYLEWEDAAGRHYASVQEAASWHLGLAHPHLPATLAESIGYPPQLKTTVLYYLFGPSPLLPQAFVATGTVSICIAVYWIMASGRIPRTMRRLPVLLSAFLPSFIFWHTLDNKDGVTAFCAAWSLLGLLWAFQGRGKSAAGIPLLVGMDLLALFYRPYVGILLITGQGLAWAYTVKLPGTPSGKIVRMWLFVLVGSIAVWSGRNEMKDTYGEQMGLQWAANSYTSFWGNGPGATSGSQYEINIPAANVLEDILGLPIRILLLLLSPIPLFAGSFRKLMSYPEQWFIYLYVVPCFFWGLRLAFRNRANWTATVLLTVAPIILAYALKTSVSGEAARMRTQFTSELFVFTGIGRAFLQQRKEARRAAVVPAGWPRQEVEK